MDLDTRARWTSAVRRLGDLSREDDRWDRLSMDTPIQSSDVFVVMRSLGIWVLAVCALFLDRSSDAAALAAGLAVVGSAQPMVAALVRRRSTTMLLYAVSDIVLAVAVGIVRPENLPAVLLAVSTLTVWNAIDMPLRDFCVVGACAVCGVVTLAIVVAPPYAERFVVVLGVFVVAMGAQGVAKRRRSRRAHQDLVVAIQAAGGLTYTIDLQDWTADVAGDIVAVTGWTPEEFSEFALGELTHPDDARVYDPSDSDLVDGQMIDSTLRMRAGDGTWRWIRHMSRVVVENGRCYLRGFAIDVTQERLGLDLVRNEASTDELTGLSNRRALIDDLRRREERDDHHLVLVDLNRFKEVNDTHGHEAGDQLLVIVANRLRACVRPEDGLYRLGGDEFAVLLDAMGDVSMVVAAVDRLALEVARPFEINGLPLTTSLSAGIAIGRAGDIQASTMLRHADMAMYHAKRLGRTSVVFGAHLEGQLTRRIALTAGLEDALEDGTLGLRYQPIVEASNGRVTGAEGLARWLHPDFGMLSPYEFLDIVLQSEHAGTFTRRMVMHACDAATKAASARRTFTIAVNIPVPVFEDPDFFEWFVESCASDGIDPGWLVFEIAERDFHHTPTMSAAIDRFAEVGVAISIDDFGTGHATFERLRWRNVEQLKLDGAMVRGACDDVRDARIIESVIDLARGLGYTVVAEGVETIEQFRLLRDLHVDQVQGWLFSAELSLDALLDLIDSGGFEDHEAVRCLDATAATAPS